MSSPSGLFQNRYVHITNAVSGYCLLAGSWGTNPDDHLVHQYPLSEPGPNVHGFDWILFPTTDGSYLIVNRVSGFALLAGSYGEGGDRELWQYRATDLGGHNPDAFKWGIEPVGANYRIINRVSGFALLPGNYGVGNDRAMWQYPLEEGKDAFLWKIDATDALSVPALKPGEDDGVRAIDVPRLQSMTDTPQTQSASWVVAETLVPFMYVTDGAMSFQLQLSPYYILSRERYWKQTGLNEYDGATDKTIKQNIKVGISESSSRSMENVLRITIAADATFSYGPASVALKTEIQNTLKVAESTSQSKTREEETTIEITVPKMRCRVVTWQLAESFTLWRGNRQSFVGQRSESLLDNQVVNDIWPSQPAVAAV
jgi:hypothetical protein